MPDGSVPVLEANVVLHSIEHPDWKNMTIGIPLAMLKKPEGEHEVVLNFSGVRWTMYVDGELLDNDFPFGYPQWAEKNAWKLDPEYVKKAAVYLPAITARKESRRRHPTPRPTFSTGPLPDTTLGSAMSRRSSTRGVITYSTCMIAAITKASSDEARTTSSTFPPQTSRPGPNTKPRRLSKNNGNASARARRSSSMISSASATVCTPGASIRKRRQRGPRNGNT